MEIGLTQILNEDSAIEDKPHVIEFIKRGLSGMGMNRKLCMLGKWQKNLLSINIDGIICQH